MTDCEDLEFYFISVRRCVELLYLTIFVFSVIFLLNTLVWKKHERHSVLGAKGTKEETILIPCNKGACHSISLFLVNLLTLIHLSILPIVVYDTVLSNRSNSASFWRSNAIVFILEYSTSLVICLGRRLFCWVDTILMLPSTLRECNHVFLFIKKTRDFENLSCFTKPNEHLSLTYRFGKTISQRFQNLMDLTINKSSKEYDLHVCKVTKDPKSGLRYFTLKTHRFVYSDDDGGFVLLKQFEKVDLSDLSRIIDNGGLKREVVENYLSIYGENVNNEGCPSFKEVISNNLFTMTFLLQYLMLSTTFFLKFFTWSFCWSGLILYTNFSCILRDYLHSRKIRRERDILDSSKYKLKRDHETCFIESRGIVPLDIIMIESGNVVPCNVVLISGDALVDESNLTGRSIPVLKRSLDLNSFSRKRLDFGDKSLRGFVLFSGSRVVKVYKGVHKPKEEKGCVTCVVLNTGIFTNNFGMKSSIFCDKDTTEFHYDIPLLWAFMSIISLVVIIFQILISPFCIGSVFFMLGTIMQLLPIWAPTTVLSSINLSTSRLYKKLGIYSFFPSKLLFASRLHMLLFDKTGTLTSPKHSLFHVEKLNERFLEENSFTGDGMDVLGTAISTCHSLNFHPDDPGNFFGDEIDKEMLRYTKNEFRFEKATERGEVLRIIKRRGEGAFRIIRVFHFDSVSRCMSVVVKCEKSGRIFLFSKGAPETIMGFCNKSYLSKEITDLPCHYSSTGSYVLMMGFRELDVDEEECLEGGGTAFSSDNEKRRTFENNLIPIGILCFSNLVREEAKDVISQVRELGIQPVILTGDDPRCALSVAKKIGLLNESFNDADKLSVKIPVLRQEEERVVFSYVSEMGNLVFEDEFRNPISVCDMISSPSDTKIVCTYEAFSCMESREISSFCQDSREQAGSPFLSDEKSLLDQVLRNIVVISRSTHLDKLRVVERLMGTGRTVGMVGDGLNDIAAIKRSSIGILINNNGDINTHFVLGKQDLRGVLNIIYEACNSASVSRSLYLLMIMYGVTLVLCKNILLYFSQATLPVMGYFAYSILINFPSMWAIKQSKPAKKIRSYPVNSELMSKSTMMILFGFISVIGLNLSLILLSLSKKSWFISSYFRNIEIPIHLFARQDGFEPATVVIWMCSLHSHTALILGFGGAHREPFYKNKWLMVAWIVPQIGILCALFSSPSPLTCLFKINCDHRITPSFLLSFIYIPKFVGNNTFPLAWRVELFSWILVSFFLCILIHKISNGGHFGKKGPKGGRFFGARRLPT